MAMPQLCNARWYLLIFVMVFVAVTVPCHAVPPKQQTYANEVEQLIDPILDRAESDDNIEAAADQASQLFCRVAVWGRSDDSELFQEADYARRLLSLIQGAEGIDQVATLRALRRHPRFAHALAFLVNSGDEPEAVLELANRLLAERGDRIEDFANLAAALVVVHDEPLERSINENTVKAEDPIKLFDYYSANEKRMLFGIRNVPPELLVYVVDSTATIPEMKWALAQYRGDNAVGKRFFDIEYDTAHFRQGKPKRVTVEGYNLPNILRYGGVCADQAYFAVSIGKAIGVPTAYTRGRNSQVSHAWVGFLQADRKQAAWNFDEGRYSVYKGVRGVVEDPQSRQDVPSSVVSLMGEMIGSSTEDRYAAIAIVDAVRFLNAVSEKNMPFNPPPLGLSNELEAMRGTDKQTKLALLEDGLRRNPGCTEGWLVLAQMASAGELDLSDKKRWSQVLMNLCGDKYPDFTLTILEPMIQTIEDPQEQNKIWDAAAELYTSRKDLSAEVLMAKGEMWASHGEPIKAGRCYEEVIKRYVNDGPFVLHALDEVEQILRQSNNTGKVLQLYDQTWNRVEVPSRMGPGFRSQSNWYMIGNRYVEKLREFGYTDQAAKAEAHIKRVTGG